MLFPFKKIRVKRGTLLIETVLSRDPCNTLRCNHQMDIVCVGNWLIFNAKISRANPGRSKAIYRPSFLIWNILFTFYKKWKHSRFCACAAVFIWSKLILLGRLQIFLSLFFQVDSSYSYYPAWTASWSVLFITILDTA